MQKCVLKRFGKVIILCVLCYRGGGASSRSEGWAATCLHCSPGCLTAVHNQWATCLYYNLWWYYSGAKLSIKYVPSSFPHPESIWSIYCRLTTLFLFVALINNSGCTFIKSWSWFVHHLLYIYEKKYPALSLSLYKYSIYIDIYNVLLNFFAQMYFYCQYAITVRNYIVLSNQNYPISSMLKLH